MAEPLISVIIAARDAGHILSRAIESALKQSWRNIELIVVDDASTDDTGKVVASFDDPRLILLHNDENRHISVSTNRGIMTDRAARKENIGGEVLCYVW